MKGATVAKAVVVWGCVVLVGLCAWGAVLQHAYAPQVDSGIGDGGACVQVLPHYDDQGEGEFNAWVRGVVGATGAVNVEYEHGVWYADGVVVGYGATDDAAIYNYAECVP